MKQSFLTVEHLKKGFGAGETRQEVLRGLSFDVAQGEFCALLSAAPW